MAKCTICEKELSHGNKISIARSHVSRRANRTFQPKSGNTGIFSVIFFKGQEMDE